MKKIISSIVASVMLLANAEAQTAEQLPYGYRHTIEFSMGHSRNIATYGFLPDKGLSVCAADRGFDFQLRYSLFFTKHWGAYATMTAAGYPTSADATERAMERDGRYTYTNEVRYDYECFVDDYDDGGSASSLWLMAGGVYRYDIKRWSFRGRLGLGFGDIRPRGAEYIQEDKLTSQHRPIDAKYVKEIAIDGGTSDKSQRFLNHTHNHTFAIAPSLQVTFTPRHHMFFSAEVGFIGNIGKQHMRIRTYNVEMIDPDSDKPAMFPIYGMGEYGEAVYNRAEMISVEHHKLNPGQFMTFNLGIGWNIGWNSNR